MVIDMGFIHSIPSCMFTFKLRHQVICGRGANVPNGQFINEAFANTDSENETDTNPDNSKDMGTMIQVPPNTPPDVTVVSSLIG